jgi:hypothetical protein
MDATRYALHSEFYQTARAERYLATCAGAPSASRPAIIPGS